MLVSAKVAASICAAVQLHCYWRKQGWYLQAREPQQAKKGLKF